MIPRLLELFCSAGGSAMGYHQAGFTEIVGVDINPQPRFPFEFVQADALEFVRKHGHEFDLIAASPPCQAYNSLSKVNGKLHSKTYPDLIAATREALQATGKPYVIENVRDARKHLIDPVILCGTFFGLKVYRHRLFECFPTLSHLQPHHLPHNDRSPGCNGNRTSPKGYITVCGGKGGGFKLEPASNAMGIDWMTRKELALAIPPAYTRWIGKHMIEAIAFKPVEYQWGADGVGRGNCAGLNVWAVCGIPKGIVIDGVKDSKKTNAAQRVKLAAKIHDQCVVGLGVATPAEIDDLGINVAEKLALSRAIAHIRFQGHEPTGLIGDLAMPVIEGVSTKREKSADDKYPQASAASIAAKYALDLYWERVNEHYPNYGFLAHAGYVQHSHLEAMNRFGLIPGIHRLSYKPCREKAAIGVAADQLNTEGQYTMVATVSAQFDIEALTTQYREELATLTTQAKGFDKNTSTILKKANTSRQKKVKQIQESLEFCSQFSIGGFVEDKDFGSGLVEDIFFDADREIPMLTVQFDLKKKDISANLVKLAERTALEISVKLPEILEQLPEISSEQNQTEIAESLAPTERTDSVNSLPAESVPVEIAGTSDTDEVNRIVEEIRDLDRSYGLEIARRLLRLQQIWKPSLEFPNFGDFCTARLGKRYGKSYRNELIAAAKVVEERLPTGVSGHLTGVDQATTISKVLNAGASPDQVVELIEDVLEAGSLSADKLKAVAQERGLLPKKQPTPIVAAAQSVGLSGKETQQLPDVPPNADIPPDSKPNALYNCCSQPELKIFCEQHTQDAIAQLKSLDWEKRFELRGIWAEFEAWLATCAFHRQIDAQGVLTLMEADSKAKIKWLESEVSRLIAENEDLRLRLQKPTSTRTDEWYTPPEFIEMARQIMGSIDLDPASNELAQSWIKATKYFTKDDDGLHYAHWYEWNNESPINVWCNPPYGRGVEEWLCQILGGYQDDKLIKSAVILLNRTGAAWYKSIIKEFAAICEVHKRIAFIDEHGQRQSSPRYYNDFLYLGEDVDKFVEVFSAIGDVTVMQQSSEQQAA